MNLDYSEDQLALGDLVASICRDHCSTAVVRAAERDPRGYAAGLWEELRRAGLLGTLIPEEFGGNAVPMPDNAVMYLHFGRALAPVPHFVSCVLVALAVLASGKRRLQQEVLPRIADGSLIATPAWLEPDGAYAPAGVQLRAEATADGVVLDGRKRHVFFGCSAGKLLVLARTGDRETAIDLFLVDARAPGIRMQAEANVAGESQCLVHFDRVAVAAGQRLSHDGQGWAMWQDVMHQAIILDAARAVGLAARALEITVQYAKERRQFDKPIAAFQAISHYLADCSVLVDGARALVFEAAWAHGSGKPYRALAAMARLFACDAAREVTAKAQQVHGGIGFTLDYDIQLFFRRAKQQQLNWWDSRHLEELVAAAVLDDAAPIAVADPFA